MPEKHVERSPERAPDPDFGAEPPDVDEEDTLPAGEAHDDAPPADEHEDEATAETERERIEARARRQGWVPQDEFRGRPETWKSAEQFLEDGNSNLRIANERADKLDRDLAAANQRLEESGQVLRQLTDQIGSIQSRFVNADKAAYDRARAELRAEMRNAVENADTEAHDRAQRQLDAMDRAPPPTETPPRPTSPAPAPTEQVPEAIKAIARGWGAEPRNAFMADPTLRQLMVAEHNLILAKDPKYQTLEGQRDGYDQARKSFVKRYGDVIAERGFGHLVENPMRNAPGPAGRPSGDRNTNGRGPRKGRTFDDLPKEAKDAYEKFKRTIGPRRVQQEDGTYKLVPYSKEEYLARYEWE